MSERVSSQEILVKQRFDAFVEAHLPPLETGERHNRKITFTVETGDQLLPIDKVTFEDRETGFEVAPGIDTMQRAYDIEYACSAYPALKHTISCSDSEGFRTYNNYDESEPANPSYALYLLDRLESLEQAGSLTLATNH